MGFQLDSLCFEPNIREKIQALEEEQSYLEKSLAENKGALERFSFLKKAMDRLDPDRRKKFEKEWEGMGAKVPAPSFYFVKSLQGISLDDLERIKEERPRAYDQQFGIPAEKGGNITELTLTRLGPGLIEEVEGRDVPLLAHLSSFSCYGRYGGNQRERIKAEVFYFDQNAVRQVKGHFFSRHQMLSDLVKPPYDRESIVIGNPMDTRYLKSILETEDIA